jgi:hypothetical protein
MMRVRERRPEQRIQAHVKAQKEVAVENLSQVALLDGPWQTAGNHSRPQTCIEEVELDVDDDPEPSPPIPISLNPKSAKL